MIVTDRDLLFAKVRPEAIIPTKDEENAGYDIYACFDEDYIILPPGEITMVPTGIAACVSNNWYLQVEDRGSTAKNGLTYAAGVVDSSYRGEIFLAMCNPNPAKEVVISKLSKEELVEKYGQGNKYTADIWISYGDESRCYLEDNHSNPDDSLEATIYPYDKALAQLVPHPVPKLDTREITYEELQAIPSKRGLGKLGSSGK